MIRSATGWLSTDIRTLASEFLGWWLGELRQMVPDRLLRLVRPSPRVLAVELGPLVVLKLHSEGREQIVAQFGAEDRASLASALSEHGRSDAVVIVRLPPEKILRRRLDLPLTRDRDLRPLLSFELGRQTPLAAADVHYDLRILSRDRRCGAMSVEVAMAKRPLVEAVAAEIASWVGHAVSVTGVAEGPDGWCPTFLAPPRRSPAARRRALLLIGLGTLAVLLAIGLITADAMRRTTEAAALQAQVSAAKEAAERAQALEQQADALMAQRSFMPDLRRNRSVAAAVDEVARLLPDDTWLNGFTIDGDAIRIQGYSATADRLIEAIDASTVFTDAHFTAPLVKVPNTANDRFDIRFKRKTQVKP